MYGTNRPGVVNEIVASSARTSSSNSGNLKDTANAFSMSDDMVIALQVTAYTNTGGGATPSFDSWVDASFDGGTTWTTALNFSAVTTSTGTRNLLLQRGAFVGLLDEDGAYVRGVNTTSTRSGFNFPLPLDVRIRWEIPTNHTVTFSVHTYAQP
jgi:hypothetical protein